MIPEIKTVLFLVQEKTNFTENFILERTFQMLNASLKSSHPISILQLSGLVQICGNTGCDYHYTLNIYAANHNKTLVYCDINIRQTLFKTDFRLKNFLQ